MWISLRTQDTDERAILYMWLAFELPLEVTFNGAKKIWDVQPLWRKNYWKIFNGEYKDTVELFIRLKTSD